MDEEAARARWTSFKGMNRRSKKGKKDKKGKKASLFAFFAFFAFFASSSPSLWDLILKMCPHIS
ncbi:MAG: hypothetical protein MOB07_15390 [Acidobacteria bacterium]|nr:hypothetical protein [Acidobacteriota bacterium]